MRHGEPSVFKHVVYVIKENRTYDQVFGDMKEGNGDPKLCIFGEEVTPNQHELAREFTLFDNFYCSGVLSADGHSWVNEAYCTDYLEKAFGGFTRSYPYEGGDALAFASSGFLWDNALARQRTFRNYGEFVKTTFPEGGEMARFLRRGQERRPQDQGGDESDLSIAVTLYAGRLSELCHGHSGCLPAQILPRGFERLRAKRRIS